MSAHLSTAALYRVNPIPCFAPTSRETHDDVRFGPECVCVNIVQRVPCPKRGETTDA
jgi:hypothetical protein